MILSDFTLVHNRSFVQPLLPRTVHKRSGMSFGLSSCGYDVRIKQDIILWPFRFVLASTIESFEIPQDVAAVVHDKSTLARRGICVQNTFIEPGWKGFLTLEITNHSWGFRRLFAGQPIAQIVFHRVDRRVSRPYSGKYQDQSDGPTKAIFEVRQ